MRSNMKCEEVRETLPDLAAGLMEPSDEMREHLQACALCAAQLQEFRQTMALMDEWEAPEPSPYFDTRLEARLREEKAAEAARGRGWLAWLPRPALAMAAALSILTPPSISSRMSRPLASIRARASTSFGIASGMNFCPPNPGLTDISNTRSILSMT